MSIDMKNYAGELESPAAVEQQPLNSYARNEHEFPVLPLENQAPEATPGTESPVAEVAPPQEDVQALNFKALSESVERLKAEREAEKREHQLQLDMLRANLVRQSPQEAPKSKNLFEFEGMQESDVPNVGEIKTELRKAWNEREAAYKDKIEELEVASKHSDYAEVLNKHGKHLAETDPIFLQGLRGAENKALFAYQYAKREARLQRRSTPRTSPISLDRKRFGSASLAPRRRRTRRRHWTKSTPAWTSLQLFRRTAMILRRMPVGILAMSARKVSRRS